MSAQNVWTCLQHYRHDTAKQIERLYGNNLRAIIAVLEKYGDKGKYVGHASAINKTDKKENSSVKADLDKVYAYLKKNAPPKDDKEKKPQANSALKAANEKKADELKKIIKEGNNLEDIRNELTEANPGWQKLSEVWDAYRMKYREKRGNDPKPA